MQLIISAMLASLPTMVYDLKSNSRVLIKSECVTVKVTNHVQQEINQAQKHGGPFSRHFYYVENAPIEYFSVDAGEPMPIIRDGMTTIKISSYNTKKDSTVSYSVETSVVACPTHRVK